jgi:uncharacterized surface protein with fasciclin (FAS1) repeats
LWYYSTLALCNTLTARPIQTLIAKLVGKGYLTSLAGNITSLKNIHMSNITQVVNVDKNLKTLKKGVHASDLDQLLSSTGPFTFFAPSDLAFEKLEKGMMENLLEPQNRLKLADLLHNHIVNGKINYAELKDGDKLTTVNGKVLTVAIKEGSVHIGETNILPRESKISNGVIHLADTVLQ